MNSEIYNSIIDCIETTSSFQKIQKQIYQIHQFYITKSIVLKYYLYNIYYSNLRPNDVLESLIRIKPTRSNSGELEISTILPPHPFSCKYDCAMCPNEPGQPRSYLSSEGTPQLGVLEDFDPKFQIWRRLIQLEYKMGHHIDKMIHILLGGTFHSFPSTLTDTYIHELYYACNVYPLFSLRQKGIYSSIIWKWLDTNPYQHKKSLKNTIGTELLSILPPIESFSIEKIKNSQLMSSRVTGLVIETRPDQLNRREIKRLRYYGVTRVQLGVQHQDENILQLMNRRHTVECSKKAIRQLKDNGFKVDIHLLLDCPGTTIEKDYELCKEVLQSPFLVPDYLKLYICVDVPFTKIRKYKQNQYNYSDSDRKLIQQYMIEGKWKLLSSIYKKDIDDVLIWNSIAETNIKDFYELLQKILLLLPRFVRLNRFHRDFPLAKDAPLRLGYESDTLHTNLRQLCVNSLQTQGIISQDIRSREIRNLYVSLSNCFIYIKQYRAQEGIEYFISIESPVSLTSFLESKLLAMIRCRISDYDLCPLKNNRYPSWFLPIFHKKTLRIRELHVYGHLQSKQRGNGQHRGFGKILIQIAEQLALYYQMEQIVVISGVGVQKYYEKNGYFLETDTDYMYKPITHVSKNAYLHLFLYSILSSSKISSTFLSTFLIKFQEFKSNNIQEKLWILPFHKLFYQNNRIFNNCILVLIIILDWIFNIFLNIKSLF